MPRSLIRVIVSAIVLVLFMLAWRYLQASGVISPERLEYWVTQTTTLQESYWFYPALILTFIMALLVMFPLTVLVITTGLLYGPGWGLFYATLGTLSSSVVSFWVGHAVGRDALRHYGGERVNQLSRYLSDRGIRTMVMINLLPIAPFTLTNMLAGASHVRFSHYLIGSAIGIIPGLAAVTLLGSQLGTVILSSEPGDWLPATAVVILCFLFLGVVTRLAKRRSGR